MFLGLLRFTGLIRYDTQAEEEIMDRTDSRYPYTYAADYLREKIGDDYGRGLISRAAASRVRTLIADACGLDDIHVAEKLADAFLAEKS